METKNRKSQIGRTDGLTAAVEPFRVEHWSICQAIFPCMQGKMFLSHTYRGERDR